MAASVIAAGLVLLNLYSGYSLLALLAGFWLMMLMFGTKIKTFLSEPQNAINPGEARS